MISCSWGPPDGRWNRPDDTLHNNVFPLPANSRLALNYVTDRGRGGNGCVVLFAAGNGNESVDNDGYASYERVIAWRLATTGASVAFTAISEMQSGVRFRVTISAFRRRIAPSR